MVSTIVSIDQGARSRNSPTSSEVARFAAKREHRTESFPSPRLSEMRPTDPPFETSGAVISTAMVRSTPIMPRMVHF